MAAPNSFRNAINNILGKTDDAKIDALWVSIIASGNYYGSRSGTINEQLEETKALVKEIEGNVFHTRDIIDRIAESQKEVNKLQRELKGLSKGTPEYKEKELELAKATLRLREDEQQKQIDGYNKIDRITSNWDNRTKQLKKGVNEIRESINKIGESVSKALGPWTKMSQTASDYAKNIGLSGKGMDKLRKLTIDTVANRGLGIKYNTSVEELMKLQQGYNNATGRQIRLSGSNYENIAATSRIIGSDNATELLSKFENFGLGIDNASERVGKMFSTASKYGISLDKYTKNIKDNMFLAQKYTFRNGLRGLDSMAKKATEIGLNMSQAASFAEKVNTIEGAVRTGAQLQVLGGPFSQMANPIGMLYEGLNDIEGLQDRMTKMFGNLGTFNRQTGEVELSAFNKVRIREAAKSMGLDENNIFETINNQARRNEIARQLSGNTNINKETLDLIKNVGVIKNGVAGVNINGNFVEAGKITNRDARYLQEIARSESDDVKDIAVRLRGWDDSIQGFKKQREAVHGQLVESMGIGKAVQDIVNSVGGMKTALQVIAGVTVAGGVIGAIGGIGGIIRGGTHVIGGIGNLGKKGISTPDYLNPITNKSYNYVNGKLYNAKSGGLVTKNIDNVAGKGHYDKLVKLAKIGKVSNKLMKGATVTGIAGAGISYARDLWINSHKNRRGKWEDYTGSILGGSLSIGGLGAQIGSIFGLPGTIIGAGIGGLLGAGSGLWNSVNNRRRRQIYESLGMELNGSYYNRELKQIRAAARGEGTLSAKLVEKMQANGDSAMLEEIKNIANSTVLPDGSVKVTILNAQKKATGGIIQGPSTTGDKNVVMSNAGEMVLNKQQQSNLFNAIKSNDLASIKVEPRKVEVAAPSPLPKIERPRKIELTGTWNINLNVGGNVTAVNPDGTNKKVEIDTDEIKRMIEQSLVTKISEELSRMERGGRLVPEKGYLYQRG